MTQFTQTSANARLWIAVPGAGDAGWVGLVLNAGAEIPSSIDLAQALSNDGWKANFVLSAVVPDGWNDPASFPGVQADALVAQVDEILGTTQRRYFLWAGDPTDLSQSTSKMGVYTDGTKVNSPLIAPVVPQLAFQVNNGCEVSVGTDSIEIVKPTGNSWIEFTGAVAPRPAYEATDIQSASIPMSGAQRGTLQFSVAIKRTAMGDNLRWGFQVVAPVADDDKLAWLPLAAVNDTDVLGFDVTLDPTDPCNATVDYDRYDQTDVYLSDRTYFAFTGENVAALGGQAGKTVLSSGYRTVFDYGLQLTPATPADAGRHPARLVFTLGSKDAPGGEGFVLGPQGDFTIEVPGAPDQVCYELRGGLSGTETVSLQPGDVMRFRPNQPAYAHGYPFGPQSPVGPPVKANAQLLEPDYLTSWTTVLAAGTGTAGDIHYLSQPKGASLFGKSGDNRITPTYPGIFGFEEVGYALPQERLFFPLLPYAGWVAPTNGSAPRHLDGDQLSLVETKAVAPTRRGAIGDANARPSASKHATLRLTQDAAVPKLATTPTGLIVQLDAAGKYECLLLGQYDPDDVSGQKPLCEQLCDPPAPASMLGFCQPDEQLQQAFQTNQLFLVVANKDKLGRLVGYESGTTPHKCFTPPPSPPPPTGTCESGESCFQNSIRIQEWVTGACVGLNNAYNDYRSVMIVKGRKGKLQDLVANTDVWTQRDVFGAPADLNEAGVPGSSDPGELPVLSLWLQQYLADAAAQTSPYFQKFQSILADENWTGILILKGSVLEMPGQLKGLLGGIVMDDFYVHHFGIEISPIKGTDIQIQGSSSMFGLIYYVDPAFVEPAAGQPVEPVPPAPGDYDFKVLTLKVLFENAAVKDFQSYAQLTLNELFGQPVTKTVQGSTENPYNTIVLAGSYQNQGGKTFYVLDSIDDNSFYFTSNVMNKVEVTKTQFVTVSDEKVGDTETIKSRFDLWGFIDFKRVQAVGTDEDGNIKCSPLDLFSYGSDPASGGDPCPDPGDTPRSGLKFSSLGIDMIQTMGGEDPGRALTFDPTKIAFDPLQSTTREKSLVDEFALVLKGLKVGTKDNPPSKQGYLPIATEVRLGGVEQADTWYALDFQLNMGSPGELAGKVGFNAGFLIAWAPGEPASVDDYPVQLGIKLPGTSGGAKTLSLEGVIKLSIGTIRLVFTKEESFLLNLYDIALKFLGMLKIPPNGTVAFYLFGNPEAQGDPSALGWYAVYAQQTAKKQQVEAP